MFKPFRQGPFKPLDVGLALFLAGAVPTVLMAVISYSILRGTLESSIVRDRFTLVQSLGRLINAESTRTGEMLEYYVETPQVQRFVLSPYGDADAAAWLAEAFYSHPRTDGMFLTDAAGRLVCAIPSSDTAPGNDFSSSHWLAQSQKGNSYYVSGVFRRIPDGRLCTTVAMPVRAKSGEIIGYMGATVLVERIGRRISALNFGEEATEQVLDQTGTPLFDQNLEPNVSGAPGEPGLLDKIEHTKGEHFEYGDDLVTFQKTEGSNWTALLRQPMAVAYRPVRNLVGKTAIIAAWLVALYAVGSWLISSLYRKHLSAMERIDRETSFSQSMLANMPIGIALLETESLRCLQGNAKFLEMARSFGGAPPEKPLAALTVADLPRLRLERAVQRVMATGAPFHLREQGVPGEGERENFLSIHLAPLSDTKERAHGLLLLLEDTTHEVRTRQELIDANAAKDQFLALLSHELRNPLSPVITMVSELDKTVSTPEERNALEIIQRNVELEARLIDDLLDVTRISHGKLQLTLETIDAHRAIFRALEICQRDIDAKRLGVNLKLQAQDYHVKADPARFQQVLWNLVKNAVKFTEKGSITIRSANRDGRRLLIEVSDTGIGIAPERLGRIFRPFEQGESAITRRFGGLGLGLAISKALIEAHDGALEVRSEGTNRGATFAVELAAVDAPAEPEKTPAAPELAGSSVQHRILLVDDHIDTCTGMTMILERRGYEVQAAHDVAGALKLAETFPFELIISDLGLPDGTGFDLIRELRRKRGENIRSVALSGYGMEGDIARSHEAGFDEHLIKPVNLERLGEILQRVFQEPRAEPSAQG